MLDCAIGYANISMKWYCTSTEGEIQKCKANLSMNRSMYEI